MSSSPIFRLRLFANPSLAAIDGSPLAGRAVQRHRLALLALLTRSRGSAVSRDVLMAHLWPESDLEHARNLLKGSVYVLRQAMCDHAIVSGVDGIRLSLDIVDVDVVSFEEALARGEHEAALSFYRGPFLEGFFLRDAPGFGHWVDRERNRLADAYGKALTVLAQEAETRGDMSAAVEWWKARAVHDPYDSRVALRLMQALVASGTRATALLHARAYTLLVREELGIEPEPEIGAMVERLRGSQGHPAI